MKLSFKILAEEAGRTGFRPEVLEKVCRLQRLLAGFCRHPFLKNRLALKGGTALNLFLFDMPRLSVDIDLNYIGQVDREAMLAERPQVEQAIQDVCRREVCGPVCPPGKPRPLRLACAAEPKGP
jgi:predicted nucleotidyltransferase component of viral defense system